MARLSDDLTRLLDVGVERVKVALHDEVVDERTARELENAFLDCRSRVTEHLRTRPKEEAT